MEKQELASEGGCVQNDGLTLLGDGYGRSSSKTYIGRNRSMYRFKDQIANGANFAVLAQEHSQCPVDARRCTGNVWSRPNGEGLMKKL